MSSQSELKASWEEQAHQKSSQESASSYDGPIIKNSATGTSTEYLPKPPVQLSRIDEQDQKAEWKACIAEAEKILVQESVSRTHLGIYVEKDASGTKRTIMRIVVNDGSSRDNWKSATIKICSMLFMKNGLDLAVQFCVPPEPENHCFAIEFDDPLRETWLSTFKGPVMQIIQENTSWETVGVFRYGLSSDSAKRTIIITVPDFQERNHTLLEEKIRSKLDDLNAGSLDAKILQGHLAGRLGEPSLTGRSSLQAYAERVDMGHSIGSEGSTGTLGGFVRLKRRNEPDLICALTAYHIVRHRCSEWKEEWDKDGLRLYNFPREHQEVDSPAPQDHEIEKQELEKSSNDSYRALGQAWRLEKDIRMGDASQADLAHFSGLEAANKRYVSQQKLYERLDKNDLKFGTVIAASGYRTSGKQGLDWALIRVEESRIGENKFPDPAQLPAAFALSGRTTPETINTNTTLYDTKHFFKIGRTTALTTGTYNGIATAVYLPLPENNMTYIRRQERRQRDATRLKTLPEHEQKREYKLPFYSHTDEHTIVAMQEGRFFSLGGDSGAWVFDNYGALVGMVFATNGVEATYFTPIGLIVEDIKHMTGCTVELL